MTDRQPDITEQETPGAAPAAAPAAPEDVTVIPVSGGHEAAVVELGVDEGDGEATVEEAVGEFHERDDVALCRVREDERVRVRVRRRRRGGGSHRSTSRVRGKCCKFVICDCSSTIMLLVAA